MKGILPYQKSLSLASFLSEPIFRTLEPNDYRSQILRVMALMPGQEYMETSNPLLLPRENNFSMDIIFNINKKVMEVLSENTDIFSFSSSCTIRSDIF